MSDAPKVSAECLTPILFVHDFSESMNYYTQKLLFNRLWDWGDPPSFGAVRLDKVEIFFCLKGQGRPGTWLCIFVDDVDDYFDRITRLGAEVIRPPKDEPWDCAKCTFAIPTNMLSGSVMASPFVNRRWKSNEFRS